MKKLFYRRCDIINFHMNFEFDDTYKSYQYINIFFNQNSNKTSYIIQSS